MKRYRCTYCGSTNVEFQAWVHANDERIVNYDENSETWCPECEEHHKSVCFMDANGCDFHSDPERFDCWAAHKVAP